MLTRPTAQRRDKTQRRLAIVRKGDLPRNAVVSNAWDDIKKYDLPGAKNRRQINAEDKLKKASGKKSAVVFEIAEFLSVHITGKKG